MVPALSDNQDHKVRKDQRVKLEHQEIKDLWERQDRMEIQDQLERLDQMVMWGQMDQQASKVNQDQMDPLGQMEDLVPEVQLALMVCKAVKALRVIQVPLVLWDSQDLQETQDHLENRG